MEVVSHPNVLHRVARLPLVSATYGLMSSVYSDTKDAHSYVKAVCEVAEHGVRSATAVLFISASPVIVMLEPQIAVANDMACKGLDKIERTLPILQQPSTQIVSSAKDAVTDTLTSAMEKTRGVVSGGVGTVLESRAARLASSGLDHALGRALSTSESLLERYLPLTEDELEVEAKTAPGHEENDPGYYVRLGSLAAKLRTRAYARAMARIRDARQRSGEFILELNAAVDLIEHGRKSINGANQMVTDKLSALLAWRSDGGHTAEELESRTLALAHSLSQQLQTTCVAVVSGLQGLPSHIQQEALSLAHTASHTYSIFSKASRLGRVPDGVLSSSRVQLGRMKRSLDAVLDYLVNNTPLNWLVGPFYPQMPQEASRQVGAAPSGQQATPSPQRHQDGPMEVEMESLRHEGLSQTQRDG
ncbi:perilipin-2-like [Brachionichthys hirsutus]|uniref:perilipin-2-like n=1 Tax=Brachionichthys hirsutus TaxID=412623 RepID=UPI0036052AA9